MQDYNRSQLELGLPVVRTTLRYLLAMYRLAYDGIRSGLGLVIERLDDLLRDLHKYRCFGSLRACSRALRQEQQSRERSDKLVSITGLIRSQTPLPASPLVLQRMRA